MRGFFPTLLFFLLPALVFSQQIGQQTAKPPTFFTGTVVSVSDTQVTVRRRALVSNATTQVFVIDSETRIEGRLRVKANVTIRFVVDLEGRMRALSVVVR